MDFKNDYDSIIDIDWFYEDYGYDDFYDVKCDDFCDDSYNDGEE